MLLDSSDLADGDRAGAIAGVSADFAVIATNRIEDVEDIWRGLEAAGVESPGQSYDFIKYWVEQRGIREADQLYLVGAIRDAPVALMALHRRRLLGIRVLKWFPRSHVGCNAPLVDHQRLAALGPEGRKALWRAMMAKVRGADAVYLRAVPAPEGEHAGHFDELGSAIGVDTLYRSQFTSWEECDQVQRSRSRRKHDRQQGDRLTAMGEVTFEELRNGDDTRGVVDTMFRHRSARFKQMGMRDPFVRENMLGFYEDSLMPVSGVDVRLHVLRLNGAIVATRYNIVHQDRMFCLISSMSDDPAIQGGSPGKQCLLRVMQRVFDEGFRTFDMGAGFTDEKRHWCNVQTPLRVHYMALTPQGRLAVGGHELLLRARARIKADKRLMGWARAIGHLLHGRGGTPGQG
jgi:CelD/BcsL family acetyltransferase involved in cellulose biosynthesis